MDSNIPANLMPWVEADRYTVREAAILWTEQDPDSKDLRDGYEKMIRTISDAIMNRQLKADGPYLEMPYTDEHGEEQVGVTPDPERCVIEREALSRWAATREYLPTFLRSSVRRLGTDERRAAYTTDKLNLMWQAIEEFWLPGRPVRTSDEIQDWLVARGAKRQTARAIDLLIRPDAHKHKRK